MFKLFICSQKTPFCKIKTILSSIWLFILVLSLLIICTLAGTILPQEPMTGTLTLIKEYGKEKYILFKQLGLTDVFHSWWYLFLLIVFGVNLTYASFIKVFPSLKNIFRWQELINIEDILKLPFSVKINIAENLNLADIKQILERRRYKSRIAGNYIQSVKGGWHKAGASVTHIGIMILLVGCLISILTGFNGMAQLGENEGFYITDLGQTTDQVFSSKKNNWLSPANKMPLWYGKFPEFLIMMNKSWVETYENGSPKQWYSDLSLIDKNNNEVYRKVISVNNPLQYKGLDIYQSTWEKLLYVSLNNNNISLPIKKIKNKEYTNLLLGKNVGLKFSLNQKGNLLDVYAFNAGTPSRIKFLGKTKLNKKLKVGPIYITYRGTKIFSGLQYKSNPGDVLIYPGVILIIFGILIALGSRKEIWVYADQSDKVMFVGGNCDRSKEEFYEEFKKVVDEIRRIGEKSI